MADLCNRITVYTLTDLLRERAALQPDQSGYTFLLDGETTEQRLTYGELDRQARAIAAWLQQQGAAGERALLLYPPGLAYIAAFFGCLYAGVVAVPIYPPQRKRPTPRLQAIAADSQATIALTTSQILASVEQHDIPDFDSAAFRWLATDSLDDQADSWRAPAISGTTLAFLQYTSGSTAAPKGVMVSHANLLHNLQLIHTSFQHNPASQGVIWLPPYHDMGLIGGILQPLYGGFPVTLMSPASFLQRPLRWLEAIARYGGTTSGAPSFAYDLCVRRSTPEQRAALDLSSWRVAFNGAEPINPITLERFTKAFAPSGFCPESWYPCYGLAESTLLVAGGQLGRQPVIRSFEPTALERNRAIEVAADERARTLVSCGQPGADQHLLIVDPGTARRCGAREIGEIWVRGPSVAQGYWNRPEQTAETFAATLAADGDKLFLRTGDLGFVDQDDLFVTGRLKDLIIIRGRNHYPHDIELTVQSSHPALRPNAGAAFSVQPTDGAADTLGEQLVIVQEVERQARQIDVAEIAAAIRQAVAEQHELQVQSVVLLKPLSIPRTSSGKIQRHTCRALFLSGEFHVLGASTIAPTDADMPEPVLTHAELAAAEPGARQGLLEVYLQAQLSRVLQQPATSLDAQQPLSTYGLDSVMVIELQQQIANSLTLTLPMTRLLEGPSIAELAAELLALMEDTAVRSTPTPSAHPAAGGDYPASHGQQALWFLHQLAPDSSAYHIVNAMRVTQPLDVPALSTAFQLLVDRHAALRTTFHMEQHQLIQRVQPQLAYAITIVDAAGWSEAVLNERLQEAAADPFDLAEGPLLRVMLFSGAAGAGVLLLAVHHIVADFWSMSVLAQDLKTFYQAAAAGHAASFAPLALHYGDYVHWQRQLLTSPDGEQLWHYWRQQLAEPLPVLNLPTDRPRPPAQTYRGAALSTVLSAELTRRLKALAQAHGATLYMTLLATFQTLLYRATGQQDIIVGTPSTGRSQPDLAPLVGYFVNPLVIRSKLADQISFVELLGQVRVTVLAALTHQEYPFALLAEQLQPIRDPSRSPLFQVMFTLQKAPLQSDPGLASFALGQSGVALDLGDLALESLALEQRTSQFDLTLVMAEQADHLQASLQYNTDLFDPATIERMLGHLQVLLAAITDDPHQSLARLPLLTEPERQQLVYDWNKTDAAYIDDQCIHHLFEAQVARTPDATALVVADQSLTYGELNERANQLAHFLRARGVGAAVGDTLVAICIERSLELVIGLLGILKAGGAYLPLDPSYPTDRVAFMLEDARVALLLTQRELAPRLPAAGLPVVCLDADWPLIVQERTNNPAIPQTADQLAYVIYTSGSSGRPKGVMLPHRNVSNFFTGMDQRIGCSPADCLLAVTSISFDISVLELFWTLTRGAKVVLLTEDAISGAQQPIASTATQRPIDVSLFYFASDNDESPADKYRLLLEGAKFADQHDFAAVWTPERHFHAFGGLYPNPAVMSGVLAAQTERIQIRAGSVVLPLHHPVRVAEEWALVDNISHGRVGIAVASGWHADDFVFYPEHYAERKAIMLRGIEMIGQLWRGEQVLLPGGAGNDVAVKLFPRPIQPTLPIWITAAGTADTFIKAGEIGAHVLTHLLGQTIDEVAEKIQLYRAARARHGHDPATGRVTLMLHTFIGADIETVRETVRQPFTNYLRSSVGLINNLVASLNLPLDLAAMSDQDMNDLLMFAFERYFTTSALFGTVESALAMIERLKAIDVDEVACLIDFGVATDTVLSSLPELDQLRRRANPPRVTQDFSLAAQAQRHGATLMQCTPSLMRMLALDDTTLSALSGLKTLLLGGEALPGDLVAQLSARLPARIVNMYGPTETTIWSTTHVVDPIAPSVPIGQPISNTATYVLDHHLQPVPPGAAGELYIGGAGVARGYLRRPALTAERFVPNPFRSGQGGSRLYKTGDLARWRADGALEYLGRIDQQIKLRGFRIELEEIEALLAQHPQVRQAVVVAREDTPGDIRLVAYVVGEPRTENPEPRTEDHEPGSQVSAPGFVSELRSFVREHLPEYMVPAQWLLLPVLPLTPNGKVDRGALPKPPQPSQTERSQSLPQSKLEHSIAAIWQQVLGVEQVGVHDNFFDLGGHSLLMAHAHSELRRQLQVDLPLIKMLEHPTISALAAYLSQTEVAQPTFQQSHDRARKQIERLKQRGQRRDTEPRT